MTNLPSTITIQNLTIHTFGIFVLLGFLLFTFVVWTEGKKDGFDEEKLFDLVLITIVSAIFFSRAFATWGTTITSEEFFTQFYRFWDPGYDPIGTLVGALLPLVILTKVWKWSFYRIVDIFSLGLSLGISISLLGYVGLQGNFNFLFGFAGLVFLYAILHKFRNSKLKSGYAASIFLYFVAVLDFVFFKTPEKLIFYILLVTLSIVVFLFRWRLHSNGTFTGFFKRTKSKT